MKIVKNRFIYIAISVVLILLGIASMIFNAAQGKGAFNYDIQFTGGTSIQVDLGQDVTDDEVSGIVKEITGEAPAQIQALEGTAKLIKTKSLDMETRNSVQEALMDKYNIEAASFTIQDVSGTISGEMKKNAFLSVVVACICMLIYVSIRFKDFSTGASAVIALCHDALIVLGSYALFRIPLNNNFIAAILTVLGYSINATIVIFDRVRENKKSIGRNNFEALVDTSVKQTLTRSIFTSLTTFFTVASLYIFGVDSIKQFALPISVGVICGTYSSVFIAGNIWYLLAVAAFNKKQNKAAVKKK
ncbi:MAG: protein translocase subunit SecF [Clostridia bacterium]|nr:protein translocase subunit SecF [Clostridia bacterium]